MKLKSPWFLALDVDSDEQALNLAKRTSEFVGGFKVGPRLLMRYGPSLVQSLAELAPVFVDNKYFDIPSTMAAAVEASFEAGASFATVHAQAGPEALTRLSTLEKRLCEKREFKILAVTVLTSFRQETLPSVSQSMLIAEQVQALARLSLQSGISGLVCSPEEIKILRQNHPQSFLVVPGIRLPGDDTGDQSRISTPEWAIAEGASALVVGRSVISALDPTVAAKEIARRISD